jgi:succinate-semialdehyde dehydrogenase/glutarate-semialdehyde dehydrogenase
VIRLITFTGSIPVGKHLAQLAAAHMKPAIMELGGHGPVIVCEDADPVASGQMSARGKFLNAGQICVAPTRFIVHESLHDRFVDSFVSTARSLKIGNGLDEGVELGPLANARRLDAMEEFVADARQRGATIATGGERIGNRGYFFAPTVLTDVPDDSRVMNIEPFGPMAPIVRFRDLDEAIARANSLPYGLASYAFTESSRAAGILADQVESGTMAINHIGMSTPETPFGGVKESGYGREGGAESLDGYLVTKMVSHLTG